MKFWKASLATIGFVLSAGANSETYDVSGTFNLHDQNGALVGYSDNPVYGTYDDTNQASLSLNSTADLFGKYWAADGLVFDAGDWEFEACLNDGSANCTTPSTLNMPVGGNQWGGHFLVDWYNYQNFDVVNVWDVSIDPSGVIDLVSTDPDGDGMLGVPMLDGPFEGFNWSYNLTLTPQAVPVPAAVWLFGSGLLGLIAIGKRKKAA